MEAQGETDMPLGAALWNASEGFCNSLTLAQHGIAAEQEFAGRAALARAFPKYVEFWKRHVCPGTPRPRGGQFRPAISKIVCRIASSSYSVLGKLLDADDSMAKVRAGDLGNRYRNCRDAIEAGGNALQLATSLQFAIAGNPKKPAALSLARQLGEIIEPFPDWRKNWAADREMASLYRHHLVHEGLFYTVRVEATGEVLVLGRAAFANGANWKDAAASNVKRGDWEPLPKVCQELFKDTVAFIDLTYERLLTEMDRLLTKPAYQQLWGWDNSTQPAAWPASPVASAPQATVNRTVCTQACTASTTVQSW
jgi:hypothetical protein